MDKNQHPDSIWTWKNNQRRGKASVWIPYLHSISKLKGHQWDITYKGGNMVLIPNQVDCIMFYGACGHLPIEFIDDMAQKRIPLLIHRRNLAAPVCFLPGQRNDDVDILTKQVMYRENNIRRCYIARTLVRERFNAVSKLLPIPHGHKTLLAKMRSINSIRGWEARASKLYWQRYFRKIGFPNATRREKSPLAAALDAGSTFVTGILLRWVHVHKLSPAHGYLHVQTEYTSLIYDLIEPYRYIIEDALQHAVVDWDGKESGILIAKTLATLKDLLDQSVYVPVARQHIRRKNLLHGIVLALRAYLAGDMRRLVIPAEGVPIGGRPVKISYRLPGSMPSR